MKITYTPYFRSDVSHTQDLALYVEVLVFDEPPKAVGRLVDVLATKGLLTKEEIVHITGSNHKDVIITP